MFVYSVQVDVDLVTHYYTEPSTDIDRSRVERRITKTMRLMPAMTQE